MTTATPPAPYGKLEGTLASGFAITQLHHSAGHDLIQLSLLALRTLGGLVDFILLKSDDATRLPARLPRAKVRA